MQSLANLYDHQNRMPEATMLYIRCQAGLKTVFGVQPDRYRILTQYLESLDPET